ncbi:MAG: 2Fe-2S iron-sulfur cluster-binding protein [Bdellovibrionia bacterium]
MDNHSVFFTDESFKAVSLPKGANLSEHLSVNNSPLLFGCRTGICGTCMIEVSEELNGKLDAPASDERELLSLMAPGNPRARLACQIRLSADIRVKPLSWK